MGYVPPPIRLMNWILKHKGNVTDPIHFDDLYREFPPRSIAKKNDLKQRVKAKLAKVDRLEEYGLNDRVKLLYMFSQSMNEEFENMIRNDGSTLELTEDRFITYFRSADGTVERGTASPQNVKQERIENENVPAEAGAPNLVEPKREEVEPAVVKMEAAELVAPNVEPVPAQGRVEPKQEAAAIPASSALRPVEPIPEAPNSQNGQGEVARPAVSDGVARQSHIEREVTAAIPAQQAPAPNLAEPTQEAAILPSLLDASANPVPVQSSAEPQLETAEQTPAPSQVEAQNRKRKTAGPLSNNLETAETVAPKIQKVESKQEPTELTINATAILENLCNLSCSFDWSQEFGAKAENEINGRSNQKILKTKVQKVIERSYEVLIEGASSNIPASKDSIEFVPFLRVYRTWLRMTKYNHAQEVDNEMGQEIKSYDQKEDGAQVKRIRIIHILHALESWLFLATPAI